MGALTGVDVGADVTAGAGVADGGMAAVIAAAIAAAVIVTVGVGGRRVGVGAGESTPVDASAVIKAAIAPIMPPTAVMMPGKVVQKERFSAGGEGGCASDMLAIHCLRPVLVSGYILRSTSVSSNSPSRACASGSAETCTAARAA